VTISQNNYILRKEQVPCTAISDLLLCQPRREVGNYTEKATMAYVKLYSGTPGVTEENHKNLRTTGSNRGSDRVHFSFFLFGNFTSLWN